MLNGSTFVPVQFRDGIAHEVDEEYIKDFVCYSLLKKYRRHWQ